MKKILAIIALCVLPGCALLDAYFLAKYDTNEYYIITEIRTDAALAKADCFDAFVSKVNAIKMARQTALFENFSEQIPRNINGYDAAKLLNEIAQGLAVRYSKVEKVSPTYCKLKFETIEHGATTIQHVLGNRPR